MHAKQFIVPQPSSIAAFVSTLLDTRSAETVLTRGGVWLEGQRVEDAGQVVPAGAQITLHFPPDGHYSDVTIAPDDIWYEDAWLLVLNKRAGWYTGATPWDTQGNALAALTHFLASRDRRMPTLHLAHQLDRGTSGLLLCSRHPAVNAPLQAAFASHAVEKHYLCLCMGEPDGDTFDLRTGHGRSRGGRWRLYALEEVGMRLPGGSRVRLAHTSFTVQQRLGDAALLGATLHTGRTHQIRLHTASMGHPLIGDTRYGSHDTFRGQAAAWPLLHAASLRLRHPMSGALLTLNAPLPAWVNTGRVS